MAEVGTLDIHGEIQALVSDKLQVVSYKWLSRNFSVTSNDAKRILQEFVEQNGSGLEIVYTLSGWLKNSPPVYHIQLVSGVKLAEIKKQFEDNCSVQVYSVQACIPKDPAALWNSEFLQAEALFNQPSTVDNCLRDNRFCGVTNSFVKRNVNETSVGVAQPMTSGITISPKTSTALQAPIIPQQKGNVPQSTPKSEQSPAVAAPVVKSESNASINAQSPANVGKVAVVPANKKKGQNEKSSSGTAGLLANMWGRASVKSKSKSPPEISKDDPEPIGNLPTAEAQICAREALDPVSSDDDDDAQRVNLKRSSNGVGNRKRRVVIDFSDDDDDFENAVNLASPDPPKKQSSKTSESNTESLLVEKNNLNFEEQKGDQSIIKEEKTAEKECKPPTNEDEVIVSKGKTNGKSVSTTDPEASVHQKVKAKTKTNGKSVKTPDPDDTVHQKDKETEDASNSNKRRRVLKTRIDERGREVTEVVWEGEEPENKSTEQSTEKKDTATETANNRPPETKKSPALASNAPSNPPSKGGAKKAGKGAVKDPKQGNILSFFKKV